MRSTLRSHPFLAVGLLGTLVLGLWIALGLDPRDGGIGQLLFYTWRVLAAPLHLAANVLSPVTDRWPDVLDGAAVVVVGLLPYVVADWLLRRWRVARSAGHRPPSGGRIDSSPT